VSTLYPPGLCHATIVAVVQRQEHVERFRSIPGAVAPYNQVELVGRRIRQLRKQRKLTQEELARRVGLHPLDLARVEKGEYRINLDTLRAVLAELQISLGEMLDGGTLAG
jgi:ribosome-binding protein aMBF1 (putative translation factor)